MSGERSAALSAVHVGAPTPLNAPIHLAPYNPAWPETYERLASSIRQGLGDRVAELHHAGSTSVPGLAAKPIIDIVLAVADSADEAAYVAPLEARGWVLRIREPDSFDHRCLRHAAPASNLHVFSVGCLETGRMLAFRDHLRADAADRRLYETTKRDLAARTWGFTQDYADAKSAVVADIMARALKARA